MSSKPSSIAAVLAAAATTLLAGCGGEEPTGTTPAPEPSPTVVEASGPCLYDPAQVATVIPGSWEHTADEGVCTYTSDRGAIFVTTLVDTSVRAGLEASRKDCISSPKPVEIGENAFVCIEKHPDGDLVVGNVAVGSRLWSLVIVPGPGVHDAEVNAMGKLVQMATTP